MNPFVLTGFSFLLFYLLLSAALLGIMYWWMKLGASEGTYPTPNIANDPYRIAYLRAGAKEAVKIATISLIDRGLLQIEKDILRIRDRDALNLVQRPIEREILRRYISPQKFDRNVCERLNAVCAGYRRDLLQYGLMPDTKESFLRLVLGTVVIGILLTTTFIKLDIAFSQGRHNVMFLIILTAISCLLAFKMASEHPSARGKVLLADLRVMFARLKLRVHSLRSGGETNEAALLAAVFGLKVLPLSNFPFIGQLYPTKNNGGSCGGGCSSGCGGGCGSGCGG